MKIAIKLYDYAGNLIDQVTRPSGGRTKQEGIWRLRYGKQLFSKCRIEEESIADPVKISKAQKLPDNVNWYSGKNKKDNAKHLGAGSHRDRKIPQRRASMYY